MTDSFLLNAQKNPILYKGQLLKKDGKDVKDAFFHIRLLKKEDAYQMLSLSKTIYASLKPEEQTFIHKHEDISYYKSALQDKANTYIGVFYHGQLIGMSYIKICKNSATFESEIPNQQTNAFFQNKKVAAFAGDCVLPGFRGNRLNQLMVAIRKELAKIEGCQSAYSIIDQNNINNLTPYFSNHFRLISSGIDPTDGGKIYTMRALLQKETVPTFNNLAQASVNIANKKGIIELLAQNYQAIAYDQQTKMIKFTKTSFLILSRNRIFRNTYTRGEHCYV